MKKIFPSLLFIIIFFIPLCSYSQGPVLTVVPNDILCPGASCQPVAKILTITAAPGTMIDGASVYIYTGYVNGQDALSFTPQFGITGNFNATTGVLTLTGTATATQYQSALQSVCYSNLSATPVTGYRTIFYVLGALLYNPVNNHYYQIVTSANNITWTASKNAAAASNYLGMQGYLVTITDIQENNFLIQLVSANTWIGASDAAQSGVWRWVTGCEGLEDAGQGRHFSDEVNFSCLSGTGTGTSFGGNFINWAPDEPNNCFGIEDYAHFWFYGVWNDYTDNGNVTNYIIEYGCMPNDPVVVTYDSITVFINDSIPTPVLSNNMPVCDGDTIQLNSTNVYTPNVSFQWTGPNSFSSTNQNTYLLNASQTLNGNYTVSVMDSGCTATATININQPPPITSTINSLTNVLCNSGNTGSIDQTGTNGAPGYTYLWSNNQNSAVASGLTAGTYTVTITDNNGCTGTSSFTITEPTILKDAITAVINVSCQGNDGQATASATGGVGPYTFMWNNGQVTATATGLAIGVYTATVTDNNNCTSTATVALINIPALSTISIANPTICIGQNVNLTIGASNGTAPYTYLWSTGAIATSINVNPIVTTNYTVTVTDANNCTSLVVYTVNVNQAIGITSSNNDTAICKGEPVNLSVNVSGGSGSYTYTWSNGSNASNISITPLATTTIYVAINDNCGTPSITDSVHITVMDYPVVNFNFNPIKGCMPLEVTFTDTSVTAPGSTYLWDFGDNGISSQMSPVYTYLNSGVFDVTLTVTTPQGCETVLTKQAAVDVYPTPDADFSYAPAHPSIFFNNVEFTDLTGNYVSQWFWNFGDSTNTSSVQNPMHVYKDTGTYIVTLIVSNSYLCGDTIFKTLEVTDEYSFYIPNGFTPNNDGLNDVLNVYGFNINSFLVRIYNRWGQLVKESNSNPVWDGKDQNGNILPQGVYAYYIITYENITMLKHEYRGTVTILR